MGLVMRDGINRLRHAKNYSGFHSTICVNLRLDRASSPAPGGSPGPIRAKWRSPTCVVIWGTNAVNTQVNVMTHAVRARKERGAKIVAIDVYMNGTMRQADLRGADPPGYRRRACLRGDALPVSRRASGLGVSRALHRCAARAGGASAHARPGMGGGASPGCDVADDRGVRAPGRRTQARLFPAGLRLRAVSATAPPTCMRRAASLRSTGAWRYEGGGAFHNNGASFTGTRP